MTPSELRRAAEAAEERLDWRTAAKLWREAEIASANRLRVALDTLDDLGAADIPKTRMAALATRTAREIRAHALYAHAEAVREHLDTDGGG